MGDFTHEDIYGVCFFLFLFSLPVLSLQGPMILKGHTFSRIKCKKIIEIITIISFSLYYLLTLVFTTV